MPGLYNETYFKNNPEETQKPAVLYCVVLVEKKTQKRVCVKVGIAKGKNWKDVIKRSAGFTGYEIRIQKVVPGPLEDIYHLEQWMHESFSDYKYKSPWRFGGHTELFQIEKLNDILAELPKSI